MVAVGTGQALNNARNCDGDVVLSHAPALEETFVAEGHGVARRPVMANDFVLLGPAEDPAGATAPDAAAALEAIARAEAPFVSRGDDSGTHVKELSLWEAAGVDPRPASGSWYRELGAGMGPTLNAAVAMGAYVLSDRATWISHGAKGGHRIVSQGDPRLLNSYPVIVVSPEKCPNAKAAEATAFADWLTGPEGQAAIAGFRKRGEQLFLPTATGD